MTKSIPVCPNPQDTWDYLRALIPTLTPHETVELRGVYPQSHLVRSTWHTKPGSLIGDAQRLREAGFNVYVGINPRLGRTRGDAHVSRVTALAADIDDKVFATRKGFCHTFRDPFAHDGETALPEENRGFRVFAIQNRTSPQDALAAVASCPLVPTVVIHSGGGFQAYWLLDAGVTAACRDATAVLSHRLARLVVGPDRTPDTIGNAERVLRLPGSLNYKYDPPRPVAALWVDGPRYTARGVRDWLDEHAPWTAPAPPKPFIPAASCDGLIDDFNARYDVGALLLRHGARELRSARSYRRFAKAGQGTISATLDYHPGVLILQAQGFLGLDKDRRHGYSAFAVYTHLEHGGDGKAAYQAAKVLGYGQRFGVRVDTGSSDAATRRLLAVGS